MNIIKQFFDHDINELYNIKVNNKSTTCVKFRIKNDILCIIFTNSEPKTITTKFSFHLSKLHFMDIFNYITLEDIEKYDVIKKLKEDNQKLLFLNHVEYMEDYSFCDYFMVQFEHSFLKSIQNYTLSHIILKNIIQFLSQPFVFHSSSWSRIQTLSFLIAENNFCFENFINIQENSILYTILKYNLEKKILNFEDFTSFLNNLQEEDIIFVILKQSNNNFLYLDNKNLRYKFLMDNISEFEKEDKKNLLSVILEGYFIELLLEKNNSIFEIITTTKDKTFFSHIFLNTINFINNLNFYITAEHPYDKFYTITNFMKKSKNLNLILSNIEDVKSNSHDMVYLLNKNNLINYNILDNELKSIIENIITEKQLQDF